MDDAALPGMFGTVTAVDSADYEEPPPQRRSGRGQFDIDGGPLGRLIAAKLEMAGDYEQERRQIAEDERDGSIHLVRLLLALKHAAHETGSQFPPERMMNSNVWKLESALCDGDARRATSTAREMTVDQRESALDALVFCVVAPMVALHVLLP